VDIDATIVTACSDKEKAAPTWKKTWGFHPLAVFAGHGSEGAGEPLAIVLRPGNAGSNTAADHVEAAPLGLAQLPARLRCRVLVRTDSGGGTHESLNWLASRRLQYSAGFTMTGDICDAILKIPARAWTPAYDSDRRVRPGAWVAELTGMLHLEGWPKGMRVIVRRSGRTPGRNCGSPISAATVSRASRPARRASSSPTWSSATAAWHAARTGSAAPRTPACGISRCTASARTRSDRKIQPRPGRRQRWRSRLTGRRLLRLPSGGRGEGDG
jgi:hypothetical protein